jgi:hypothetical protein
MAEQLNSVTNYHVEKITKRYIIDYLNALFFSNTVLWDGVDQFHELPIFHSFSEEGYRVEQRGALFVDRKTAKALRISVSASESAVQAACYRIISLKSPIRIDESKYLYYPLDGINIDVSVADLHLGAKDPSSYSFCDNTHNDGKTTNTRLFALLRHVIGSAFVAIDDEAIFADIVNNQLSLPPVVSDAHYKPIYGVIENEDLNRD